MKLKSGPLSLILAFGCGLVWNAVPAMSGSIWRKEVGSAIEGNLNSRLNRDVGAVTWPMTLLEVNHENPHSTRSVRTPESLNEAVFMIDDFWRNFGNSAETEDADNLEEETEQVVESDSENDETNDDETERDEQITSRFSSDSYQEISTDVQQLPQQHLSLYPPYLPSYEPPNKIHGNYLLRPPPPLTMYSSSMPHYGNAFVPGDTPVSNQDADMDMEFHGNRAPIGMAPAPYARSMSQQTQNALQYPPIHPQLMFNYYMMNAANFQNPHMNPGTPQAPQMGYSIPGAMLTSQVSSSIPQPSYPFLGTNPSSFPGVSTYPYHQ